LIVMLGMTAGPLFAGFMADQFDGYRVGFVTIAIITGLGAIFFLLAKKPNPPVRKQHTV